MSAVLGGMVPSASVFTRITPNDKIQTDGRATPAWRAELRKIPNFRNAISVVSVYVQASAIFWVALVVNNPLVYVAAFLLIGRTHAQLLALMHEAAHRLLFSNHRLNDFVGRWIVGYPSFTNTDGYRRVHMAHHRQEFGPTEPDIPLYANYPITRASFWRKMRRDAFGRTGGPMLLNQLRDALRRDPQGFYTQRKIFALHLVAFVASAALVNPYIYVFLWLMPYLTVWRVMNRLRSIAEHGGLRSDDDRRVTTHSVRQHLLSRFYFVPFNLGMHIAHHLDSGIPFRSLRRYHKQLRIAGVVTDEYEYANYRSLWRSLRSA
ncbi:MAG: fatty acid desaturase [Acidimicrobiaceae bacterium]